MTHYFTEAQKWIEVDGDSLFAEVPAIGVTLKKSGVAAVAA
ncbi:MAG: hypothetical protein RL209_700 [Pseudomonadota bacterium]|jgi:hypothetical protein